MNNGKAAAVLGMKIIQADYEMIDKKRSYCFLAIKTMNTQEDRILKLESALQKVLSDSDIGIVPRSHLDNIENC